MNRHFHLLLTAFICALMLCSCKDREAAKIEKLLEGAPCWVTHYDYQFELGKTYVYDQTKFSHGKITTYRIFQTSDGTQLFSVEAKGSYEITRDSDLDAYFLDMEYDDNLVIKNINLPARIFDQMELEYKLDFHGDAYDMVEDEDDDTLYGEQIIEYSRELIITKDLEDGEVYKYTPSNIVLGGGSDASLMKGL